MLCSFAGFDFINIGPDEGVLNLAVFASSAHDFIRLKGDILTNLIDISKLIFFSFSDQSGAKGKPATFTSCEDTEVPALQRHCHDLATTASTQAALKFATRLEELVKSMIFHLSGNGISRITEIEKQKLRNRWESENYRQEAQNEEEPGIIGQDDVRPME